MNYLKIIYSDGASESFPTPMDCGKAIQYARKGAETRGTLVRGFVFRPIKREAHRPIAAAR